MDNKKIAKELVKIAKELTAEPKKIVGYFHEKDDLMACITYDDVIVALQSNYREEDIDEKAVREVFNSMKKDNLTDAMSLLRSDMKEIIKSAKS